jgi:hypothetical protein
MTLGRRAGRAGPGQRKGVPLFCMIGPCADGMPAEVSDKIMGLVDTSLR